MNHSHALPARSAAEIEARQARFALALTARLSEGTQSLPGDITERLRFARERALERARRAQPAQTLEVHGGAAPTLALAGPRRTPWWLRVASVLPLFALLAGLLLIQESNTRAQIRAAAEIDAALLADDLPPSAYSDPGFGEFLKTPGR